MSMGAMIAGIAASAVSAGTSIYSATQSGDAAEGAAGSSSSSAGVQSQIARDQWNRYLSTFAPMEDTLVKEVTQPARENAGYLAQMGDINRNYNNNAGNVRAAMGGKMPYGSGISYGAQRSNELNRTKALSTAESTWNQNRLANMFNVARLGQSLVSSAGTNAGSAANSYADLAKLYAASADSSSKSAGSSIGDIMSLVTMMGGSGGSGGASSFGSGMTPYLSGGYGWG